MSSHLILADSQDHPCRRSAELARSAQTEVDISVQHFDRGGEFNVVDIRSLRSIVPKRVVRALLVSVLHLWRKWLASDPIPDSHVVAGCRRNNEPSVPR